MSNSDSRDDYDGSARVVPLTSARVSEPNPDDRLFDDLVSLRDSIGAELWDDRRRFAGKKPADTSYAWRSFENFRMRRYATRLDRLIVVVAACGVAVVAGLMATNLVSPHFTAPVGLAYGSLLGLFWIFESGRNGFLHRRTRARIDDVGASLATTTLRGTTRVHAAERELVLRALGEGKSLHVVDMWTGPRKDAWTREFAELQQEISAFSHRHPDKCRTSVHVTDVDAPRYESVLKSRSGTIKRYRNSPFQCDAILTEDEVILTFPRSHSNRSFAVRFRSVATVAELWDVFGDPDSDKGQVGKDLRL